ncbi:hypothetical protein E0L36_26845 [Streptomyces sp. AJS327]|uniref:hypothetical protein n=1 Tax=Streptomyces sp. AJS327 TaxID=2545265 RepID=UPI0015DE0481|nr:hypothetical protein [Streptomyces sp. AJS327]MBA0054338.1 hypothetical protein [Streptomyces sp. AJS327]
MGLLTASAEQLYAWRAHPRRIANFDVLPTYLVGRFASRGIRPDLLFSLPGGAVADEARGRSWKSVSSTIQKRQRDRLDEMLSWSMAHKDHPFIMSWSWITPVGVTVDLFHLHDASWPVPVNSEQEQPVAVTISRDCIRRRAVSVRQQRQAVEECQEVALSWRTTPSLKRGNLTRHPYPS